MRSWRFVVPIFASLALVLGACQTEEEIQTPEEQTEMSREMEEGGMTEEGAVRGAGDVGLDKNRFIQDVEGSLSEMESELASMRSTVEALGQDVQAEHEKREADLRWQMQQVREHLSMIESSAGAEWEEHRKEVESSMSELDKSFDEFVAWLGSRK